MRVPSAGCECDRFAAVDCTSCRLCEPVCPPRLDLARVVATSRTLDRPGLPHQGLFTTLATLEAQGAPASLGEWHASRPGVRSGTDVVFFPGTAAMLDPFFRRTAEYARGPHAGLLILNAAGVEPVIVGGGSGHDLWYQGRFEEFEALSRRLVPALGEALEATGGGPVVCSSAEDAHALRDLHGVEAVHVSEFLAGRGFKPEARDRARPRVAFFDPCRLGRYRGVYDEPRELLSHVTEVVDLGWARGEEPCCGVSAWVNCNAWSKSHREGILRTAHEAGVEALVTACPMCQVHLDCYYSEEGYDPADDAAVPPLRVVDLAEIAAELMGILDPPGERMAGPGPPGADGDSGNLRPVDHGAVERWLDEEAITAAHLCTLCLRCVEVCPQDAPVLEHVLAVRRSAHGHGRSPDGVIAMVESLEAEGDPFEEPRRRRTEAYPASMEARVWIEGAPPPEVLLFLGCVYSYQDPRAVRAVARVLEAAGVDYAVLGREEGCCGYVDHLAGAEPEFREVARGTMDRILATGAGVVVTPCAGCFRTFTQLYPEVDGAGPGGVEVFHMAELIDRLIADGRLPLAEGGRVTMLAYHDPCDLGRHCGMYDAPRRALTALPGVVLEEFPEAREGAACCGGGGALRAFDPGKAMDIARDRLASLVEGIDWVASACPSCKANLRLAASRLAREEGAARLRVLDLAEVVASRLDGGER